MQVVLSRRAVCALSMVACSGSGSGSSAEGSSGSSPIGLGGRFTETVAAIACWQHETPLLLLPVAPAAAVAKEHERVGMEER